MKKVLFSIIVLSLTLFLNGQETAFKGEVVEVRVIDVPVQVTDKEGNPIINLKPDDFLLFEGGRQQDITHFFEVKDSAALRQAFENKFLESGMASAVRPEFHKRIIIFIDGFHMHPHNYLRLEGALETFLGSIMVEGDFASIYMASPSVKRLKDWTDNVQELKQILREFKLSSAGSTTLPIRERELARIISDSRRYQSALMDVKGFAYERRYEVLRVIDSIRATIDLNRSIPGEKYFIYVGEGVPITPGLEYFYLLDQKYPRYASLNESTQYDLSHDFEDLGRMAASYGFIMYLIDARGLVSSSPGFGADVGGDEYLQGNNAFGASAAMRSSQDSLRTLADITGGRAIINTNDFKKAIGKFSLSLNHYYSLAFKPEHKRDGQYHALRIKLKNPEFTISFREGYTDYLPGDNLPIRLQTYLVWDQPPRNPLHFDVWIEKSSKKGRHHLVPIKLLFPKATMPFSDGTAVLRIGVVIGDEEGRKSAAFTQKLKLSADMWKDKDVLGVPLKLQMRKGKQTLIVGVEDPFEDISYIKKEIKVPIGNE